MSLKHSISVRTHIGHVAVQNEDNYIIDAESSVCFLADGMGGHVAGQHASRLACATAQDTCREGQSLTACIEAAHAAGLNAIADDPELRGMGTTMLALAFRDVEFELAWVGDSRGYQWRARQLEQLTCDHNYAEALIANGMSPKQAWQDPRAARLTQAVGVHPSMPLSVEAIFGQLFRDEFILLCSDGLTDELSDEEIAAIIELTQSTEEICERLVQAALAQGGRDNITVILVRADQSAPERPGLPPQRARRAWYQRLLFWRNT